MTVLALSSKQNVMNWVSQKIADWLPTVQKLPNLEERMDGRKIKESHYAGLQKVALDNIRGTASTSRSYDFDVNFRLTNPHNSKRLESVLKARQRLSGLPPIALIFVDGEYYVQDGHHRVAVYRAAAEESIWAHVTVLELV